MRFLHVTTHYPPDYKYGGVVEVASALQSELEKIADVRVAAVSAAPEKVKLRMSSKGLCWRSILFHRFGFSLSAIPGLWTAIRQADVVYVDGIVTFPNTLAQFFSLLQNKPFAIATHGLTKWAAEFKPLRKSLYYSLISFPLMRMAKFIRVTSRAEREYLESKGFLNTLMLSNGIPVKEYAVLPPRLVGERPFVFLFLGRMGKEKGLDILLKAYEIFRKEFPTNNYTLKLVGPDLQHYLASLKLDFSKSNIEYIDGIYGEEKHVLLRCSDVLVLPSYSENFGNVVAEALASETPVITTTGTPWTDIEKIGCGIYIKPEADALFCAMRDIYLKTDAERHQMGRLGREYVFNNFNCEEKSNELLKHLIDVSGDKTK